MPITPFHFGPGAALKGLLGRWMSLATFVLANCVIDIEPIGRFFLTGVPSHPHLHTLPGATLVAVVTVWPGRRVCEWAIERWSAEPGDWALEPKIPTMAAVVGAALGAYSHIALDAIMHLDVHPLWPFDPVNHWQGLVSLRALHAACIVAGVLGLVLIGARRVLARR